MQSGDRDYGYNSPNGAIHGDHDLPDGAHAVLHHRELRTVAQVVAVRQTKIQIRPCEVANDPAARLLLEDPLRIMAVRQNLHPVLRRNSQTGFRH